MKIFHNLEEISTHPLPIALTIGVFDGVHRGHQHLLQELKKYGTPVVLTFSNHPSEVFSNYPPIQPLCSLEERLDKLADLGIASAIVIPFTYEFSQLSYEMFLRLLHSQLPFSTLLLGEGEAFGHQRQGTQERVQELGLSMNFQAIYLQKATSQDEPISSQRIRALLAQGRTEEASHLLRVQ